MSIYGVDLGTFKTTIATVQNGRIEIVLNEMSNRSSPTVVGFSSDRRLIGDASKDKPLNFKNTVSSLLRLIGRSPDDPEVQKEQNYVTTPLINVDGEVGVQVRYLDETRTFTATQLTAMFLTYIKRVIAQRESATPHEAKNVAEGTLVLTCPYWFQDSQRRRLQDAARIAGWKRAHILNDSSAVAFGHGFDMYNSLPNPDPIGDDDTLPPAPTPKNILYVSVGHSALTCYVASIGKVPCIDIASNNRPRLEVKILSVVADRNFGGRDYDRAIVEHFNKQFEGRFEPGSLRKSPKAQSRLYTAANKLRKVLSINSPAQLSVECIYQDTDVSGSLSREEFEELIESYNERIPKMLEECLAKSGLTMNDIEDVNLVGGTSRTASFKDIVAQFTGKELRLTLNLEEAAARGAAYYAASLSPIVRIIPCALQDATPYPIRFWWDRSSDLPDTDDELLVYGAGKPYPSSKVVTFYRKRDFTFNVNYAPTSGSSAPVKGVHDQIAQYKVTGIVAPAGQDEFLTCKLRVKLDDNGIFSVSEAFILDENNVEETEEVGEDGQTRKVKKGPAKIPLTITAVTQSLTGDVLEAQRADEERMSEKDHTAKQLDNLRNDFEDRVLSFSSFVSDSAAIPQPEKDRLSEYLRNQEEMLFDYRGQDLAKDLTAGLATINAEWSKYGAVPASMREAN